jgi:hypothetical protein
MKKIQFLFATIVLALVMTSCGDAFLTRYPQGGVLLQDQYDGLSKAQQLEGAIKGIYSKMYEYGGDHDAFGQRAIDMYGDIQCGDMAMKKSNYGWFEVYERGQFRVYASGYLWSYYYDILNLINLNTMAVESSVPAILDGITEPDSITNEIAVAGYYYGQLLAMRGWAYANLLNFYCDPMDALTKPMDEELAIPVYTETEVKDGALGAPRVTVEEVYARIYEDLSTAIELLDTYGELNQRASKLEVDADVARVILAYAMLNHGNKDITVADGKNAYEIAVELATAVITNGKYPMLKKAELTTTGFADVTASNWMWGQDVTVETTTALASFFGQVDVHTYSYAQAGDTKAIDTKLYDEIAATKWDARIGWFAEKGSKYAYVPDGKFYCPRTKSTTASDKVDRDWLCDNIFMRIEVAYLIAAEAAWANGDYTTAAKWLTELCNERVLDGKDAEYTAWTATLTSNDAIKNALVYNWRVEMWGEGYGLQTLRRLSKSVMLGENHLSRSNKEIAGSEVTNQCQIPSSETRYNPWLATTNLTHDNGK